MSRIVYHRAYNVGFFGLERFHPFDSRKYGRAWKLLQPHVPKGERVSPQRPASHEELLEVHSAEYLDRLNDPSYVAQALELAPLRYLPRWLVDRCVLEPMRWATTGSVVAAREALQHGFAINLGGGFHHAKPDGGEGFCIYSDIALAIHMARKEGLLADHERVAYVDLDAHQGNGVSHAFLHDSRVSMFDVFNSTLYPYDAEAKARVDCPVPLTGSSSEGDYLSAVRDELPGFLDSAGSSHPIGLAIYNAGTDVYEHDTLGGLNMSAEGIATRDAYVVSQLRERGIPTAMLLSGGYSRESFTIIANSIRGLLTPRARQERLAV